MHYLDPKSDIGFKKLFGDQQHAAITINFLNAVLEHTPENEITELTIIDPFNHPSRDELKNSAVDVRCKDKIGNQYIVEMQVIDKKDFGQRSQYYSALALANQLNARGAYKDIRPVAFVGVVDFPLDPNPDFLNHHRILNTKTHQCVLQHLEFHFLELAKFKKTEAELETIVDKWAYLFKIASSMEMIPSSLQRSPAIVDAFGILERSRLTEQEFLDYLKFLDAVRSEDDLRWAGREEGAQAKAREIARGLLDVLDVATIARKTGLSENEVRALKNEIKGASVADGL